MAACIGFLFLWQGVLVPKYFSEPRPVSAVAMCLFWFVVCTSQARACQSSVSAFESSGEVRLIAVNGVRQLRYVTWSGGSEVDFPLTSPALRRGQANWLSDRPVDRVELVHASVWRRDIFLSLASKAESIYWRNLLFDADQWNTRVARYDFSVSRTLAGAERRGFTLDRIQLSSPNGGRYLSSYWFLAPPTQAEERRGKEEALSGCDAVAALTKATCDRARVLRDFQRATVYVPRRDCSVYYAFRLGRPAVFYWRGGVLVGVAEVTPEAYAELMR